MPSQLLTKIQTHNTIYSVHNTLMLIQLKWENKLIWYCLSCRRFTSTKQWIFIPFSLWDEIISFNSINIIVKNLFKIAARSLKFVLHLINVCLYLHYLYILISSINCCKTLIVINWTKVIDQCFIIIWYLLLYKFELMLFAREFVYIFLCF